MHGSVSERLMAEKLLQLLTVLKVLSSNLQSNVI
jgi:hypothetical protein